MVKYQLMSTFSITFRPKDGAKEEDFKEYVTYLDSRNAFYLIGDEMSDKNRHIQSVVKFNNMIRIDNITRSLKSLFNLQPNTDEWKHAIKVNRVSDDELYVLGYCMKEKIYKTNLEQEQLDIAKEHYAKGKPKLTPILTLKNVAQYCVESPYYQEYKKWPEKLLLRCICTDLNNYELYAKINKKSFAEFIRTYELLTHENDENIIKTTLTSILEN